MFAMMIQRRYRKYVSLCRAEEQLQKILVLQVSVCVLVQIIFKFKLTCSSVQNGNAAV